MQLPCVVVGPRKQQDYLKNFLRANDFPTVHSSRAAAFQGVEEMVYPIHGAAILGAEPVGITLLHLVASFHAVCREQSGGDTCWF